MSGVSIDFGALLRRCRLAAQLTQEELAEQAAVSSRTVRDLERGAVRAPRRSSAEALAAALNLTGDMRADFLDAARSARWGHERPRAEQLSAALAVQPRQLPADARFFTGRLSELETLDAYLSASVGTSEQASIIAIVGTAGVGKTALAVHWARRVSERFADGQLYVNLRGYGTARPMRPVEALAGFLRSLGLPNDRIPTDAIEAENLYRTFIAGKRVLVIADNARTPEQVRPLLPASPGSLLVTTSRQSLGGLVAREGARRLVLSVLPPADAIGLMRKMLGETRSAAEPHAMAELAKLCSYMPLSLRIAAAVLATREQRPISDYVAALMHGDPLDELTVEGDPPDTVRTVLDQSYTTLSPDEQRIFQLASIAPGPDVSVGAVSAMAEMAPAEASRLLNRLAEAHMMAEETFGRYSLHDLLRAYGRERARAREGDTEAAVTRLFEWYLATASAAARELYPERVRLSQPELALPSEVLSSGRSAMDWLSEERLNLVAVIHHAAEHGPHAISWLLLDALRGYFWMNNSWTEWLGCARAALGAARTHNAAHGEAAVRLGMAQVLEQQGRLTDSRRAYEEALKTAERAGWRDGQWVAQCHLGIACMHAGRLRRARTLFSGALSLCRSAGLANGEASALHGLGRVALVMGEPAEALSLVQQARAIYAKVDDLYGEAGTLVDLAVAHRDTGRVLDAIQVLEECKTLADRLHQPVLGVRCGNALAGVHRVLGQHRESAAECQRVLHLATRIGSRLHETEAMIGLACAYIGLADLDQARQYLETASGFCRQSGYRLLEADTAVALAQVCFDSADLPGASWHAGNALTIQRETGYRIEVAAHLSAGAK